MGRGGADAHVTETAYIPPCLRAAAIGAGGVENVTAVVAGLQACGGRIQADKLSTMGLGDL